MDKKKIESDAYQWAYDRYIKDDPEMEEFFQEMGVKAQVARLIHDLREQADLSREQLAELAGVTESVIEELEEADYEGDFMGMASRVAAALHRKVEIRFVPMEEKEAPGINA